jgi:hypothetical protein
VLVTRRRAHGTSRLHGAPLRPAAGPFNLDQAIFAHLAEHVADHVTADTWCVALDVGDTEGTDAPCDGRPNLVCLRTLERGDAFLELTVGADEDAPEVFEPRMRSRLMYRPTW